MTFLPIIDRELRVRARGRATYWSRFAVALVGALICWPQLISSGRFGAPATIGWYLLNEIVCTALLLSCGACLLTADVISSERREGTLGLLLLTRVNTFDVLLGKLGSAGLTSLCALVAFLPLLMIPVLAGGVTGGEVFRKGLALLDTLFLALAAGLWASARGREWLKTGRNALIVVAIVLLVPGLLELLLRPLGVPGPGIGLLSPLGAISAAGDVRYKVSAVDYWTSLLLVHAMGWALVVAAGFRLRTGWREDRGEITPAAPATAEAHGAEAAWPARRPLGDANPITWLLQRQRGTQALLWAGALVGLNYYPLFVVGSRFLRPILSSSVTWPLSLATMTLEGVFFAWAASRFFVEARRTGELELLLTTPLGARQIVPAQWNVLKRSLRWPMLVLLAPALLQVVIYSSAVTVRFGPSTALRLHYAISGLLRCVNIFFGVGALCWVGLWFGLKAGGQARAIVWTVTVATGLPFLTGRICSILFYVLATSTAGRISPLNWITLWLPQVVNLLLYLGLIQLARRSLLGGLAAAEPLAFDLRQSLSSTARDALAAFRKARHWTPS